MSALVLFEARMFRLLAVTVPVMAEDVPVLAPVLVAPLPVPEASDELLRVTYSLLT